MPKRASPHPLRMVVPAGATLYVDEHYHPFVTVAVDTPCTVYRFKRGGRWAALGLVDDWPGGPRKLRVEWRSCRRVPKKKASGSSGEEAY